LLAQFHPSAVRCCAQYHVDFLLLIRDWVRHLAVLPDRGTFLAFAPRCVQQRGEPSGSLPFFTEEQGGLELEGAHSACCLTEKGRKLIAKQAH
jgi:hypothetical protein